MVTQSASTVLPALRQLSNQEVHLDHLVDLVRSAEVTNFLRIGDIQWKECVFALLLASLLSEHIDE